MTSERQRRANQANARKSTGPKTARGRAISSRNARKHGLNSPPAWGDVTRYYRIILEDASVRPDPMSRSDWERAALALAEAEARLAQCATVEHMTILQFTERSDNGVDVGSPEVAMKMDPAHEHMAALVELLSESEEPVMGRMLKRLQEVDPDGPTQLYRRLSTLRRYRREAEARRRKALKQWLKVSGGQGGSAMATTAAAG